MCQAPLAEGAVWIFREGLSHSLAGMEGRAVSCSCAAQSQPKALQGAELRAGVSRGRAEPFHLVWQELFLQPSASLGVR